MKRHLKYALELLFVPIAAAIVFIEETLLHYLGLAMAAIAKWPPVARLEAWLRGLPPWAASLLGGVLVAGIGYLLIRSGRAALNPHGLAPQKTIDTLKEDAQWLKAQAK